MFFKLFAVGFMMDSRTIRQSKFAYFHTNYKGREPTNAYATMLMDPEPSNDGRDFLNKIAGREGIRSLKDLLEKKAAAKNQSFFKSGRDERYDILHNETNMNDLIFNITKFTFQMKLLKKLESEKVSVAEKLTAIAEYKKDTDDTGYVAQLKSGGIWKDWNIDL